MRISERRASSQDSNRGPLGPNVKELPVITQPKSDQLGRVSLHDTAARTVSLEAQFDDLGESSPSSAACKVSCKRLAVQRSSLSYQCCHVILALSVPVSHLAGAGEQPGSMNTASGKMRRDELEKPTEKRNKELANYNAKHKQGQKKLLTCEQGHMPGMLAASAPGERCGWCGVRIKLGTPEYM